MAKEALPDLAVTVSDLLPLIGRLACSAFLAGPASPALALLSAKNSFLQAHLSPPVFPQILLFSLFLKSQSPDGAPVLRTLLPCWFCSPTARPLSNIQHKALGICAYLAKLPVWMKAPGGHLCPLGSLKTVPGTVGINEYLMKELKKASVLSRCLITTPSYLCTALWSLEKLLHVLCHWLCTII